MKLITQSEYQKLCPILVELSKTRGHPSQIRIGELKNAFQAAGLDPEWGDVIDINELFFSDLPTDCESAVLKIINRLEEEVDWARPSRPPPASPTQ